VPIVERARNAMRRLSVVPTQSARPPERTQAVVADASWEQQFTRWIVQARATGADPNDIGDREWESDRLDDALHAHYVPLARGARVVELGPGSGRLTRHLVDIVEHLTLLDASEFVCHWIEEYLRGHDNYEVHHITGAEAPMVPDSSADAVFAHGVVEHLDPDQIYWFLRDFHRMLVPGGNVVFNFDNVTSCGGINHLAARSGPRWRSVFRFHAPAAIVALGEAAGFDTEVDEFPDRIAFAVLTRPSPGGRRQGAASSPDSIPEA
jgi:SAM-dependent methyltransferase